MNSYNVLLQKWSCFIVAFETFDIVQGSVVTQLKCGEILIANFLLILKVK